MADHIIELSHGQMLDLADLVEKEFARLEDRLDKLSLKQSLRRGHAQRALESLRPVHEQLSAMKNAYIDRIVQKLNADEQARELGVLDHARRTFDKGE